MVYVDLEYIGTALYNLLENALRYAAKQVQLQFQCEERMLVITVTDDGPGIPAEIKERIFEPFYRGETHRPQNAAHGLGLPTARLIIERFKGTLAIHAGQPAGTSVEIRLPRISSE
jgi:signal transduction histidine kinase